MEDRDRAETAAKNGPPIGPERCARPACCGLAWPAAPGGGGQDWHDVPDTTAERSSLAATSATGALARLAETLAHIPAGALARPQRGTRRVASRFLYPVRGADDHPGPVAGPAEIGIVRDAAQFVW